MSSALLTCYPDPEELACQQTGGGTRDGSPVEQPDCHSDCRGCPDDHFGDRHPRNGVIGEDGPWIFSVSTNGGRFSSGGCTSSAASCGSAISGTSTSRRRRQCRRSRRSCARRSSAISCRRRCSGSGGAPWRRLSSG